ncbi:MAG TPA: MCP four helix bundle domain-containing protein, partial [Gammaproteobacteria bacterium]|nr:MCP four helix bundle domain-containing protein [Gammaproteobacteria bacterium]
MKKLTIRASLWLLLGFACAVLLLVASHGLGAQDEAADAVETMYAERLVPTWQMGHINELSLENTRLFERAIASNSISEARKAREAFEANAAEIDALWPQFLKSLITEESKHLARQYEEQRARFIEEIVNGFEVAEDGDFATALMLRDMKVVPAYEPVLKTGKALLERQLEVAQGVLAEVRAEQARERTQIILMIAIGLAVIGLFGFTLIRNIRRPLEHVQRVLSEISEGRLGHELHAEGKGEIAQMVEALAAMDRRLVEIVSEVREGSDAVSAAAVQISQGNDDLSQRTQEQASSLEETASSMEE